MDQLKWVYIGSSQWRCSEFPLRMSPYFMTKILRAKKSFFKQPFLRSDELENLCLSLQHTRHFEWSNHFDFIPPDFSAILRCTKNMKSLSLSVIDPYVLTLQDYDAINRLRHLTRLSLSFYVREKRDLFPIERMFNVLSRTRELAIGGTWWCNLDEKCFTTIKYQSDWDCEKISIPIALLPLTYYCPLLKEVVIVKGFSLNYQSAKLSFLFRAENMQKLDIQAPLDSHQTKDLLHLLSLLKKLQSVGLFVNSLDLVEFFEGVMSPDKSLQLKLPLLEELVIHGTNVVIRSQSSSKFSEAISRIMRQRAILRRLSIHGIKLDASLILQGEHWACNDLEYLHITCSPFHIRDYQSMLNTAVILSDQLGRCVNLKTFSISWGVLELNEINYRDKDYIRRCLIYLGYHIYDKQQ
ncbi:MAG: hypothetical protein J3R72DRAFT_465813 [Linnemannia gamsii]|nr:MAG: hypothetical protein J3R72DRAFT_465813 [Linnemannia gamsii]